ncbi:YopX family protein [Bacillus vallismortis]|uniref:YopX family protein n=1 Tax=Bacillus vallismortis TaxID=72361 RepID=UPI00227F218A|nr:YopX family protein [Bacillus vallismortis]MCY8424948.1 YopX family protein [Bacillus vallismortis]
MSNIKIRYAFRHKKTGNIELKTYFIGQLEDRPARKLSPVFCEEFGYELISRDLWTGEKDKDGQEIYEGDVDIADDEPMIVAFKDGRFGLKFPDHDYFDSSVSWEDCEIGGNVHQNPELLGGAKR